ncbi:relaxase/mobilization nuclease domain-containing protein [Mucilaginibacter flavus]|uniref:relaxase/mobilization nuclease domain-containing protein n=1 Tax=Mucilaginibacter flavus TaxID=931504 RepID=UPI0025B3B407|nr:relaxase/mobilization nuclease domain-containing protein [Mucilaginibacter flavus]MDN3581472.1 relaxase/mobilization nuclease domain-containing protein [Mucilaginibacter flavus]
MIASQKIGKSFMGALNYNLKKMYHPDPKQRAELLDTNFSSLDKDRIKQEIALVREQRPNLNRYVYHTSLNFSKEDNLSNEPILDIAHRYLEANGFGNNQYFIFRHHDADHPHIHLLVNRITFDGQVVSDSNNYKRSESILRDIEKQFNLTAVESSHRTPQRAAKKDEIEMVIRTGKPSQKMVMQEIMKKILNQRGLTLSAFIQKAEQAGINLLFNQASTGRITGITYFHKGFKIKGQALGNSFKWAEIIKKINYEQTRDSKAISETNSKTRRVYGEHTTAGNNGDRGIDLYTCSSNDTESFGSEQTPADQTGSEDQPGRERPLEADQNAVLFDSRSIDHSGGSFDGVNIQISHDEDDAMYRRKSRRSGR